MTRPDKGTACINRQLFIVVEWSLSDFSAHHSNVGTYNANMLDAGHL